MYFESKTTKMLPKCKKSSSIQSVMLPGDTRDMTVSVEEAFKYPSVKEI